ncbi:MAG: VWA domain-containing protein [Acidobacteria bacterium]|nr:VWA domain-containing protein [Acidobacteriota bacterium]
MKILGLLLFAIFQAVAGAAQTGVLIPLPKERPDETQLSIRSMSVDLCADNQTVTARIVQIFENHTAQTLEGKYVFALPETASVADFAVWDGTTRVPGVMMEKRRANEIYGEIKARQVDPGILQNDESAGGKSVFSAKVFPIPAFGTKRIEIEYSQSLPLEGFASHLTFPLKASSGDPQTAGRFTLRVCVASEFPIASVDFDAEKFPLTISSQNPTEFAGEFAADNFPLADDFALDYRLDVQTSLLSLIAYRAPETISAYELRDPALAKKNADGYFELRAVFNEPSPPDSEPRHLILLVDTSLSMYGEKLRCAVESTEFLLGQLKPEDDFNLILFGSGPAFFAENPVSATPENTAKALDFLKNSELGGGTDLKAALEKSVEIASLFPAGEHSLILISDANPTRRTVDKKDIMKVFDSPPNYLKFYGLGIGSDADTTILSEISKKTGGFYAQLRETAEPLPVLSLLLDKIGRRTIEKIGLSSDFADNIYDVYATGDHSFNGSGFSFVGRYRKPGKTAFELDGLLGAGGVALRKEFELPALSETHDQLPRLWARARIDWLVREMDLNGERTDYINEIIALSQKYKLVSPYTAFIAAPRSLLRPRLIQPGDPVIRVKTDDSIVRVLVVLPFGEILPLEFLAAEGVWENRFLAPAWMNDGSYTCRIILTDRDGRGYEETKTFVIDSRAPRITIEAPAKTFAAGEQIPVRVFADQDTARLSARFQNGESVRLFWSAAEKASVGRLTVPNGIASGRYTLTVTAEDFAHNQSSEEITLDVIGN